MNKTLMEWRTRPAAGMKMALKGLVAAINFKYLPACKGMREPFVMPGYSNGKGLVSKTSGRKALGVQVSSPALRIFEGLPGNFLKKFPWVSTPNTCAEGTSRKIVLERCKGNLFPKGSPVRFY